MSSVSVECFMAAWSASKNIAVYRHDPQIRLPARTMLGSGPAGRQGGFVSFAVIRAIRYCFLWNLVERCGR